MLVSFLPVFLFSCWSWSVRSSTNASRLFAYFSIMAIMLSKMLGFLEKMNKGVCKAKGLALEKSQPPEAYTVKIKKVL